MTHTGFKPMQNMVAKQVEEMKQSGYSDERILQDYLDVNATTAMLVMVSTALHGKG